MENTVHIPGPGDFLPPNDDDGNPQRFPDDDDFYSEEPEFSHGREVDYFNEPSYARQ